MEYEFGRCNNYLESVAVGFASCLIIVIAVPVIVVVLALLLPILGILGLIKRK